MAATVSFPACPACSTQQTGEETHCQSCGSPLIAYFETRRDPSVVDDYHGTSVPDPYRWLEDPDSKETEEWVAAQNKITQAHLKQCTTRETIGKRFWEVYNYQRFSCPFKRGSRYFFYKNDGLQNQSVLYKQDGLDAKEEVLLDPNTLTADGTAALRAVGFTKSGNFMAYGVSYSGSDWQTVHVKDIATAQDTADKLEWVKFSSLSWMKDSGLFYSRYPTPKSLSSSGSDAAKKGSETDANLNQKLYYHKRGTSQADDTLVFEAPQNPQWMMSGTVTHDGKYLLISIGESTDKVNRLFYAPLEGVDPANPDNFQIVKLIDNFEAEYDYIMNEGTVFWFKTNLNAPRGKVIQIDIANPAQDNWKDIIPHSEDVLNSVDVVCQNQLITWCTMCLSLHSALTPIRSYMHHVKEVLKHYSAEGKLVKDDFPLPSAGMLSPSCTPDDTELFYKFTSFLYPGLITRYDMTTGEHSVFRESTVPGFDPSLFETTQVFYPSKDGTKIPMYIISKKGLTLDGSAPCLLEGYGGFNISMLPVFSASRLVWVQHFGGIWAWPNLRGGGEYGEEWHKAGTKAQKQNVFDDWHSAAGFLIRSNYTAASKICAYGGSNGGLLVAASMNQRPELFGACVPAVGVLDMLRFHKFTIGYAWCSDYGCSDEKEGFEYLRRYSPLHNVCTGKPYPAVMLTTADHDDRVVPLHSFKYIAELQHRVANKPYQRKPLLIRIETKAGHGGGKPLKKVIEEYSDVFGFFAHAVGAVWV